ncbi:MAG: sugar ABC transporter permease [Clostridiales bacterium]|nr:sugar ABC transporter permease [Clostridiales bacterium]
MSKLSNNKVADYAWGYFMIAPTIIGLIILNVWPLIQTAYLSLCKFTGFDQPKFIGLGNFIKLFHDKEVIQAVYNTLAYTVIAVPIGVLLSLIIAVLLNSNIKGKTVYRTLYFLPVVSTPAAVAMVWKWLMNYDYGLINYVLSKIGIHGPNWISDPHFVLASLIIVGIWSSLGYNMVILLAGLQEIPTTYYEAASIDGAGAVKKFFSITIPMVSPTLFFVVITTMISSLQVFDLIFMMIGTSNPALPNVQSLVFLFYKYSFMIYNKGYGSAIAILLFIIIMIFTLIQLKYQKKWVHYE